MSSDNRADRMLSGQMGGFSSGLPHGLLASLQRRRIAMEGARTLPGQSIWTVDGVLLGEAGAVLDFRTEWQTSQTRAYGNVEIESSAYSAYLVVVRSEKTRRTSAWLIKFPWDVTTVHVRNDGTTVVTRETKYRWVAHDPDIKNRKKPGLPWTIDPKTGRVA